MMTASEYRRRARMDLGGRIFGDTWLMALVVVLIADLLMGFFSLISIFIIGPFSLSLCTIFYNLSAKKQRPDFNRLFDGFTKDFSGNVMLGFMSSLFIFLWSLLLIVPGIIKSYSYSMCYFVKMKNPQLGWRECLNESKRLMRGNRWRLFCLDFSFIGWILLSALTLGIGALFLAPYQQAARMNFYLDLIGEKRVPDYTEVEAVEL